MSVAIDGQQPDRQRLLEDDAPTESLEELDRRSLGPLRGLAPECEDRPPLRRQVLRARGPGEGCDSPGVLEVFDSLIARPVLVGPEALGPTDSQRSRGATYPESGGEPTLSEAFVGARSPGSDRRSGTRRTVGELPAGPAVIHGNEALSVASTGHVRQDGVHSRGNQYGASAAEQEGIAAMGPNPDRDGLPVFSDTDANNLRPRELTIRAKVRPPKRCRQVERQGDDWSQESRESHLNLSSCLPGSLSSEVGSQARSGAECRFWLPRRRSQYSTPLRARLRTDPQTP